MTDHKIKYRLYLNRKAHGIFDKEEIEIELDEKESKSLDEIYIKVVLVDKNHVDTKHHDRVVLKINCLVSLLSMGYFYEGLWPSGYVE